MASANNCPDEAVGRISGEDHRMEPSSPNEQSTSSAADTGPTTTDWTVPPSGNTEAHPTSTKRPALDSAGTASPKHTKQDMRMQSTSSAPGTGPTTVSLVPPSGNTDTHPTERPAPESPATASPRPIQQNTNMQSTSSAPGTGPTTASPSGNTDTHPTERPAPESPPIQQDTRISPDAMKAMLDDLVVEAVFPTAGFIRLKDHWLITNRDCLKEMRDVMCDANNMMEVDCMVAGSRAEGVSMEDRWGYPVADQDRMELQGIHLQNIVDEGVVDQEYLDFPKLMYRPEGCPPGYTRLEVNASDMVETIRFWQEIKQDQSDLGEQDDSDPEEPDQNEQVPAHKCVQYEGGRHWLLSRHLRDALKAINARKVKGPATVSSDGLTEWVTALVNFTPHPDMEAYRQRTRVWPTKQQIEDLLTLPMLLVCVGPNSHKDANRLFRSSFSLHEMKLMEDLELKAKQGFICFKFIMKALIPGSEGDAHGRSHVGSYQMKTVFFRYLEKHRPQEMGSPFKLALELCRELQQCLVNRSIPNYFIPECNLLEQVNEKERQEALKATAEVLIDPVAAIIKSPSDPEEIFGSRHRMDYLLHCFQAVYAQPACGAAWEDLKSLLLNLDKHRKTMYREQLEEDERVDKSGFQLRNRVSRRHGLVVLSDVLQKII